MTLLRLFCCGDRFAAKAATSLSGFLLLHQPKVYRPGKRGEFSGIRKNKNGRSRPHVNKYINQKGRLLRKQRTARSEKTTQKEALRQDISQQDSPSRWCSGSKSGLPSWGTTSAVLCRAAAARCWSSATMWRIGFPARSR